MHRPFIFAAVLLTALAAAATRGESQPGGTGRDPELTREASWSQPTVADVRARGREAFVWGQGSSPQASAEEGADEIAHLVAANACPGDVVAVLSNGGFGGLHRRLLQRLEATISQ